jgi:uncharacterized protein (DUF2062 family)
MRWIARTAQLLRHVDGSPARVATAFGIGVFIAFFPILGIHTGLALGIALLFRLNKVAILVGAWINNPWTIAPIYSAGTLVGCALLGVAPVSPAGVDWSLRGRAFYSALATTLEPLVWPFVIGNLILGALAGIAAFFLLRSLLARWRAATASS